MKLCDVVQAIVLGEKVSAYDIEHTIQFLTRDDILTDMRVLRRIVKRLNADMEYEDAPVSGYAQQEDILNSPEDSSIS